MRNLTIILSLLCILFLGCVSAQKWEFTSITYGDWHTYSDRDQISVVKEYRKIHGIDVINSSKEVVEFLNEMADECSDQECAQLYMTKSMDEVLSGLTTMAVLGAE